MARLSRIQEQVRAQFRHLAGRSLLPEPLGRRLLEVLRLAVPADILTLFGVDPASLLFNRLLAADSSERLVDTVNWLENVYLVGKLRLMELSLRLCATRYLSSPSTSGSTDRGLCHEVQSEA